MGLRSEDRYLYSLTERKKLCSSSRGVAWRLAPAKRPAGVIFPPQFLRRLPRCAHHTHSTHAHYTHAHHTPTHPHTHTHTHKHTSTNKISRHNRAPAWHLRWHTHTLHHFITCACFLIQRKNSYLPTHTAECVSVSLSVSLSVLVCVASTLSISLPVAHFLPSPAAAPLTQGTGRMDTAAKKTHARSAM
jgi:hypothetical protein